MWKAIIAKIPMIDKSTTKAFYMNALGFIDLGQSDYEFLTELLRFMQYNGRRNVNSPIKVFTTGGSP